MPTSFTIPKNPAYPISMDWTLLRREGVRHIERLGSNIWTDYNLHDPGITILEILCYAITDLGYRANLSPKDLFAGSSDKAFLTAKDILPNSPITALDYRKLLIDIPGVKNAWVEQMDEAEVRFYLNPALSPEYAQLVLNDFLQKIEENVVIENFPTFTISDEILDDLNSCDGEARKKANEEFKKSIFQEITEDNLKKALILYAASTHLDTVRFQIAKKISEGNPVPSEKERRQRFVLQEIAILKNLLKKEGFTYDLEKTIYEGDTLIQLIDADDELKTWIYYYPIAGLILGGSVEKGVIEENAYNLFIPQGVYQVSVDIEDAAKTRIDDIKRDALTIMLKNRNLGEDVHPDIKIIEKKDMGIDLDLVINPAMDEFDVLTNVYYAIYNYLIPNVQFYSLEQMLNKYSAFSITNQTLETLEESFVRIEALDKLQELLDEAFIGEAKFNEAVKAKLSVEEWDEHGETIFVESNKRYDANRVYQGPLLKHGFIDEAELIASQPRQTVYRSDLYQLLTEIEGVEQIKTLNIFKVDPNSVEKIKCTEDKKSRGNSMEWCLEFGCRCLARLDLDNSCISINKGAGAIQIDTEELKLYVEVNPPLNTKIDRRDEMDLPIPKGTVYSDLTEFTSIQEDFPRTYQIGRTGIPSKATPLRKAQAKQLQGYLLFYDQILANYLSHLSNVRNLLALDAEDGESFQALYDIPGVKELLIDYDSKQDWETFKQNPDNQYIKTLEGLVKGNDTRNKLQKNKVLDHLLGRFGEQFTDHVLRLYQIERPVNRNSILEGNLKDWTMDKQRFLDFIPQLSGGRGLGFNYLPTDGSNLWNTQNVEDADSYSYLMAQLNAVSGLKKRVCAHLGIEDWTRHTITCEPDFTVEIKMVRSVRSARSNRPKYMVVVSESGNDTERLLVSKNQFSSEGAAKQAKNDFIKNAASKNNYSIKEDRIGFWLGIKEDERSLDNALFLDLKLDLDTASDRLEQIKQLATSNCQDDSFHIIEHILLRPRNELYRETLQPMLNCLDCLELLDPYSFWLTVVVPSWVDRFKNQQQFHIFEQRLRMEAPAHLMLRIIPLDRDAMLDFETNYNQWLNALCQQNEDFLPKYTDVLVTQLNKWKN